MLELAGDWHFPLWSHVIYIHGSSTSLMSNPFCSDGGNIRKQLWLRIPKGISSSRIHKLMYPAGWPMNIDGIFLYIYHDIYRLLYGIFHITCHIHRRSWHGLTTPLPFFSNFLFANLFSITFLYYFISFSLFACVDPI
jgi:hypothetical protein